MGKYSLLLLLCLTMTGCKLCGRVVDKFEKGNRQIVTVNRQSGNTNRIISSGLTTNTSGVYESIIIGTSMCFETSMGQIVSIHQKE